MTSKCVETASPKDNGREIDYAIRGKLRDKSTEESKKIIEDLALYDNESWNDLRDLSKLVKAISLPQDVPRTSDRRLLELEDQIKYLLKGSKTTSKTNPSQPPQAYASINANPPPTNNLPVLPAALRAKVAQEINELQAISTYVDSRLENNDQFLNGFTQQPNENDVDDLEPDDESVDTPLVYPFLDSDDASNDGKVLNELEVYGNARQLCRQRSKPNGKLIYNSIMNGPYVRRMIPEPGDQDREVPVAKTFHVQTNEEVTEKELKQMEEDDQATQTILMGLPEDIYAANRNDNVVASWAEGNGNGNNKNQIRCYNCRGMCHLARNCIVRPSRRNAAYLHTQLLIAQKEEAGIQLQAEEFDLIAPTGDLDKIKEVNANCILMANLQQPSTSGTQADKAPV
nr:Gag-Pol polyprotein [Tanacetum cinerariifolium]